MQQSPELKDKITLLYEHDLDSGSRIDDYLGNTGYVLFNREYVLKSGKVTKEQIDGIELEYKKMVEVILLLSIDDILLKLKENKPSEKGTNANIEALKRAFLN